MLQIVSCLVCTTVLCCLAAAHAAQTAEDPSDPAAPAPIRGRSSAFQDYRPYAETAGAAWPALMREVAPEETTDSSHPEPQQSPAEPRHDHSQHR
jgi:hypothetical protein